MTKKETANRYYFEMITKRIKIQGLISTCIFYGKIKRAERFKTVLGRLEKHHNFIFNE